MARTKNRTNNSKSQGSKYFGRSSKNRNPNERICIVFEDSKSAPAYFKKLIAYLELNSASTQTDIVIDGKSESAPKSIVRHVENKLCVDNDWDAIFFVFDRDTHTTYDEAIQQMKNIKNYSDNGLETSIHIITSVPCFELWLKLHHNASSKSYGRGASHSHKKGKSPCDMLMKDLKNIQCFNNYEKNSACDYFDDIIGNIDTAIKNSKNLMSSQKETNPNTSEHDYDPSTYMHELVEYLQDLRNK